MEAAGTSWAADRLDRVAASFARAADAAGGVSVHDYVVGGLPLSLRFAGPLEACGEPFETIGRSGFHRLSLYTA